MPFGLTNAPATFVTMMNRVLGEYINDFVICFVDDILIYSRTKEDHAIHVEKVLDVLRKNQLYVNPDKCEWAMDKVSFLGHIISAEGVSVDPAKIEVIKSWPVPNNVTELRSFLGMAGYYRSYVPQYSRVVSDLTTLTGNKQQWVWHEAQQRAFDEVKRLLCSAPVLIVPDQELPFVTTLTPVTSLLEQCWNKIREGVCNQWLISVRSSILHNAAILYMRRSCWP
jgi:hypothetical protein